MRRENSKLNTAYISHEGSKLFNNDYYGSVELDKFACYVVADGLESADIESQSAQIAVQAAIAAFHERPSMKPRMLRRYIRAAHHALLENAGHLSLRASITVVVSDYQSLRYAWAGNTRFYLYRAGRLLKESFDHSLAQQIAAKDQSPGDKIAQHEERGNLSLFLGQEGRLTPDVSQKIKLQNGDIFTLLTRGIWEQCQTSDIRAALDSSENDPTLAVEGLERLILDPHPQEIDNYTIAVIFVDKIYLDPNKGKKLKRILTVAIPVAVVIAILAVVLLIRHNIKVKDTAEMQAHIISGYEYLVDENFPRAAEEIKEAQTLAKKHKNSKVDNDAGNLLMLIDAIQRPDDLFDSGSYTEAQDAYLIASSRSVLTDNICKTYIERRLKVVAGFISVRDLISLGDVLTDASEYNRAESKYLEARRLASSINDSEGRKTALDSLQILYEQRDRDESLASDAAAQEAKNLQEAVEMEAEGDKAVIDKDLTGANLFYVIARERFSALNDDKALDRIDEKILSVADMQAQNEEKVSLAEEYVMTGDNYYEQKDYLNAKAQYILARSVYTQLQDDFALANVLSKIELCDIYLNEADKTKSEAADKTIPASQPQQEVSTDPVRPIQLQPNATDEPAPSLLFQIGSVTRQSASQSQLVPFIEGVQQ